MEVLIAILVFTVGPILLYVALRPPVVFQIKYHNGASRVSRGRLTEARLASIREICGQNGIRSGTITALPAGKRVRMKFSGDFSPGCQQQVRNLMLLD